jgi:ABC-type phosphate transport system auxiliary subunit
LRDTPWTWVTAGAHASGLSILIGVLALVNLRLLRFMNFSPAC